MIAPRHAACDLQVQRLILGFIQFDEAARQPRPFGVAMGIGEPDAVEAGPQSQQVLGEPERMPRVHRDHFVHAVAEDEAAIEHRDPGLFDGHEFAV